MEERKQHIDNWFREGLEGYKEMPDAAVWNSLEQRLPKTDGRKRFLWLWVLLMLALLSSLGYYAFRHFSPGKNEERGKPAVAVADKTKPGNNTPVKTMNEKPGSEEDLSETKNKPAPTGQKKVSVSEITAANREIKPAENIAEPTGKITGKTANSPDRENNDDLKEKTISENDKQSPKTVAEKTPARNTHREPDSAKTSAATGTKATTATTGKNTTKENQTEAPKTSKVIIAENKSKHEQPDIAKNKVNLPLKENKLSKTNAAGNKAVNKTTVELQEKEPAKKNSGPHTTASASASKPVALQEKENKSTPATVNTTPNATVLKEASKTTEEKTKPVTLSDEASLPKPVTVIDENARPQPIAVTGEKARPKPTDVKPEANKKPDAIEIKSEVAKAHPLLIEPEKQYGIKVADYTIASEENNAEDNTEQSQSGNGGGGATSQTFKKDKNSLKLDGGIKLGYEKGFAKVSTQGFTGNLFLQWNISPKISMVLQPGIRYELLSAANLFSGQSYHEITGASFDSSHVLTTDTNGNVALIQRNFIYRNNYDSVVTSFNLAPRKYLEIELPLLFQYQLADNISLLLGGQLAFGKVLHIESNVRRFSGLNKTDTVSYAPVTPDSTNYPGNIPSLTDHFTYSTPEFSTFDENTYKNPLTNPARFSIMLGFSYEIKKRLLVDLMVRKNVSGLSFIPNEEVRKIYNQPNVRITIGYKLFRSKK